MFLLYILLILGIPDSFADTVKIRLLVRPRLDRKAIYQKIGVTDPQKMTLAQKKAIDLLFSPSDDVGHVALEIPSLTGKKLVLGWQPSQLALDFDHPAKQFNDSQLIQWLFGIREGSGNHLKGKFTNDSEWAEKNSPFIPLYSHEIPITQKQLQKIYDTIQNLNLNSDYQMVPNLQTRKFLENCFNCVSAAEKVLREAGVDTSFFPNDGSLTKLANAVRQLPIPCPKIYAQVIDHNNGRLDPVAISQ